MSKNKRSLFVSIGAAIIVVALIIFGAGIARGMTPNVVPSDVPSTSVVTLTQVPTTTVPTITVVPTTQVPTSVVPSTSTSVPTSHPATSSSTSNSYGIPTETQVIATRPRNHVVNHPQPLAKTGAHTGAFIGLGIAALIGGILLVLGGARKPRTHKK